MTDSESSSDRDGKVPGALRTIGEVAKALGIRQHVLRYWEDQFPMLKPLKRSGGRRYYRPEDITVVETIDRLVHKEGYTLKGARGVLSGKRATAGAAVPESVTERVQVSAPAQSTPAPAPSGVPVARLVEIRDRLAAALEV